MNITTFRAFKSRNYRLYFAGQSISLIGTWMQKTAVSWVVYSLTHSKLMLGVTLFATQFPSFLLSFMGGVAADRYNRYRLLLLTQVLSIIQAILLTALIYFRHYSIWEILFLSVILGSINAFDVPARQSLVYEMVNDKKDLSNALALNSSMVNLSRLIGPAIAGIAIEKLGDDICFGLNAFSFVAVIVSLLMMKLPPYVPRPRTKRIFSEMREGLLYMKNTVNIRFVVMMLALMSLLVLPFSTLLPVYAKDIFHGSASTFGVIDSAIGLGAFSGAIFLASLKPRANLNKILAINTFVFGLGLILFSHASFYPLALTFITMGAFGMMSQVTITNTLVQTTADPAMRGRMISIYAMAFFGMQPLGGLMVGAISQRIGVQTTLLIQGCIALIIGGLHVRFLVKHGMVRSRRKRALEAQPAEIINQAFRD
jgi:MFS family permease